MTQLQMKGAMIQDRKIRNGDERKLQKSPIEIDHLNSEDLKKYSLCTLAMVDMIQFDEAVLSKCTFCLAICHSGGLGMSRVRICRKLYCKAMHCFSFHKKFPKKVNPNNSPSVHM